MLLLPSGHILWIFGHLLLAKLRLQCWDHKSFRIVSQVYPVKLPFWSISRLHNWQMNVSVYDSQNPFCIKSIRKGRISNSVVSLVLEKCYSAFENHRFQVTSKDPHLQEVTQKKEHSNSHICHICTDGKIKLK